MIDAAKIKEYIGAKWATDGTGDVIEQLKQFIAIPNVSPAYDAEWAKNGLQEKVVDLMSTWVQAQVRTLPPCAVCVVTDTSPSPPLCSPSRGSRSRCCARRAAPRSSSSRSRPTRAARATCSCVRAAWPAMGREGSHTHPADGHLDKQPPLTNWHEGLGPYKPVIRDGKLCVARGACRRATLTRSLFLRHRENVPCCAFSYHLPFPSTGCVVRC